MEERIPLLENKKFMDSFYMCIHLQALPSDKEEARKLHKIIKGWSRSNNSDSEPIWQVSTPHTFRST